MSGIGNGTRAIIRSKSLWMGRSAAELRVLSPFRRRAPATAEHLCACVARSWHSTPPTRDSGAADTPSSDISGGGTPLLHSMDKLLDDARLRIDELRALAGKRSNRTARARRARLMHDVRDALHAAVFAVAQAPLLASQRTESDRRALVDVLETMCDATRSGAMPDDAVDDVVLLPGLFERCVVDGVVAPFLRALGFLSVTEEHWTANWRGKPSRQHQDFVVVAAARALVDVELGLDETAREVVINTLGDFGLLMHVPHEWHVICTVHANTSDVGSALAVRTAAALSRLAAPRVGKTARAAWHTVPVRKFPDLASAMSPPSNAFSAAAAELALSTRLDGYAACLSAAEDAFVAEHATESKDSDADAAEAKRPVGGSDAPGKLQQLQRWCDASSSGAAGETTGYQILQLALELLGGTTPLSASLLRSAVDCALDEHSGDVAALESFCTDLVEVAGSRAGEALEAVTEAIADLPRHSRATPVTAVATVVCSQLPQCPAGTVHGRIGGPLCDMLQSADAAGQISSVALRILDAGVLRPATVDRFADAVCAALLQSRRSAACAEFAASAAALHCGPSTTVWRQVLAACAQGNDLHALLNAVEMAPAAVIAAAPGQSDAAWWENVDGETFDVVATQLVERGSARRAERVLALMRDIGISPAPEVLSRVYATLPGDPALPPGDVFESTRATDIAGAADRSTFLGDSPIEDDDEAVEERQLAEVLQTLRYGLEEAADLTARGVEEAPVPRLPLPPVHPRMKPRGDGGSPGPFTALLSKALARAEQEGHNIGMLDKDPRWAEKEVLEQVERLKRGEHLVELLQAAESAHAAAASDSDSDA